MNNQNGYLVKDYTDNKNNPIISHYWNDEDFFEFLNFAKEKRREIAVFKIGKCLIDWS